MAFPNCTILTKLLIFLVHAPHKIQYNKPNKIYLVYLKRRGGGF
jgi:hypothetical protein